MPFDSFFENENLKSCGKMSKESDVFKGFTFDGSAINKMDMEDTAILNNNAFIMVKNWVSSNHKRKRKKIYKRKKN